MDIARPSQDAEAPKITDILSDGRDAHIVELDISGHAQQRWLHSHDGHVLPIQQGSKFDSLFFRDWRKALVDSFLPVGFPHSVSRDYLAYQTFDSLQAFFSTISSLLANRALLQGLGVGDASTTATYAMLLTIFKDGMSRIATIVFANRYGLRIEPDAKRYRFLADLFNDTAFFLELYSPYLGSWGKMIALCTGEALRALCGVAAGASKAALSVHFAKHDNLAELNAKEASQETAVGLVGLLVGTLVVKFIEDHTSVVCLMICLVFAHLGMNYWGVRSVCMNTFNRQRATILFEEFLKEGQILSPEEVAQRESIIFWNPVMRNNGGKSVARIEFSNSYRHAMSCKDQHDNIVILDGIMHTKFICTTLPGYLTPIKMLLWDGAKPMDAIRAWFNAMEIAWVLGDDATYTPLLDRNFSVSSVNGKGRKFSDGGPPNPEDRFDSRLSDAAFWDGLKNQGWKLDTQSLEVTAPVRLQVSGKAQKGE